MSGADEARDALDCIDAATTRDEWVKTLMGAKAAGVAEADAEAWSARADSFNERDFRATWRSIKAEGGIGAGTLFAMAREAGWKGRNGAARPQGMPRTHAPRIRAVAPHKHEVLSDYGRDLWNDSQPLDGPALAYLHARRCVIPPSDGDLRFHPTLKHPSGYVGPALVALVTHAETREPMSLHRTWIQADGTKAPVDPARMLLGGHRKAGGVIRLWPDECVTTGLSIAEGIETGLSLAHAFTPVWSVIDAGNMAQFPVLESVESLMIAADYDPAGIAAAEACATRWAGAGCEVRIVMPQAHKSDLNDLARAA